MCVGAETVIIEDTNEGYEWILKAMADIERNFMLADIHLIFADKKITQALLINLGISDLCTLRGDRWHLLNDV